MCTCLHNIILCITLAVLQPRRLHQQGQSKMKQTGKLSKMMISSMTSTLMLPTQSSPSNFLIELGSTYSAVPIRTKANHSPDNGGNHPAS